MFKRYAFSISTAVSHALLVILLLAFGRPAAAQAPAWQSAQAVAVATAAATGNYSTVRATAVDAAGNVYLAGTFMSTVVLGSTTLTSIGINDVFIAKFNPASNQFVWVQQAGGTGSDYVTALVASGTSVYVAGIFYSPTADFGTTTLTNAGNTSTSDVFVAKLIDAGSTGSFAWAQQAGGPDSDEANALAVNGTNVYVAGNFQSSTVVFGPATLTNIALGFPDVFVAKLTDTGSFTWAQRAGGSRYDYVTGLAVYGTSVYVAGYFYSPTAGFGATTLANAGGCDAFVVKLIDAGSTGSFAWAQRAGGSGIDLATALVASGASVYVAGAFYSPTAGFGTATLTNVTNGITTDIFVAKLTDAGSTGSFTWAQRAGGSDLDEATVLAVSGTNVYVAGNFQSSTVGFGTAILTNASNTNTSDVFVAKLIDAGPTGSFAWAQRAGGTGRDGAATLAVSGMNVYVAGYFGNPTADFSTITLNNSNPNTNLGFLASLTDPTLTATSAGHALAPAHLYPNPAHRTATLRLPAGTVPAPLVLTDVLGRAVRRYPAPASSEAALDLQGVPAGLYLLRGAGPAQRLVVE